MALVHAFTLSEAQANLERAKETYQELLSNGGTKAYGIGSRSWESYEIEKVRQEMEYWANQVAMLDGTLKMSRTRVALFRDG